MGASLIPEKPAFVWLQRYYPLTLAALQAASASRYDALLHELPARRYRGYAAVLRRFLRSMRGPADDRLHDVFRWERSLLAIAWSRHRDGVLTLEQRLDGIRCAERLGALPPGALLEQTFRRAHGVRIAASKWNWTFDNPQWPDNLHRPAENLDFLIQHVYYQPGIEIYPLVGPDVLLAQVDAAPFRAGDLLSEALAYIEPDRRPAFARAFAEMLVKYVHYGILHVD